jgi:hypothetical protein
LRGQKLSVFHRSRLQPFLDQADHPLVCYPMLHELNQPTLNRAPSSLSYAQSPPTAHRVHPVDAVTAQASARG